MIFFHLIIGEWVVITPSGEFDKSQGFEGLHWVRGLEVLELDQFFDHFYKPGLMARAIRMDGEKKIAAGKMIDAIMASPPPTVKIVSPTALGAYHKNDATIAVSPKGTMEVVLEVKANGGGIKDITLFHNGKPVNGKTTVRELSAFIEDKVPGLTEKHRGGAQSPCIYGRGQDFPLLLSQ